MILENKIKPKTHVVNEQQQSKPKKKLIRNDKVYASPSSPSNRQINNRNNANDMDLYEVYFNKNNEIHNHKFKNNIQKIKFKRRSPSIESF
jgi:hypothetical protein